VEPSSRYLIFHGTIILLIGLLCGAPYGRAIQGDAPNSIVHSWRVAHLSLPIGAILMLAIAIPLESFAVSSEVKRLIANLLIVSGYSFSVSLPLAALVGQRGLSYRGPLAGKVVFAGNLAGVATSLLGSVALVYAAFVSL